MTDTIRPVAGPLFTPAHALKPAMSARIDGLLYIFTSTEEAFEACFRSARNKAAALLGQTDDWAHWALGVLNACDRKNMRELRQLYTNVGLPDFELLKTYVVDLIKERC